MTTAGRSWLLRTMLGASMALAVPVACAAVPGAVSPAGAASGSVAPLFSSSTPGRYSVVVPAGVTGVTITAVGGSGGTMFNPGGAGAVVTTNAVVASGDTLVVVVAGNGTGAGPGGSGTGAGGTGSVGTADGAGGGGGSGVVDGGVHLALAAGGGGGSLYGAGGNADSNGIGYNGGQGVAASLLAPGFSGVGNSCVQFNFGTPGNGPDGGSGMGGGGGGGFYGGGGGCYGGGGGGSSYPVAASTWDTSATPSVTIAAPLLVMTSSLPPATPGVAYGPVRLQVANLGSSTSPYATTVKWKKVALPRGLKLSAAGVLSGTPSASGPVPTSVTVQVTETVVTLQGTKKVRTKTAVQATIPF